MSSSPAHVIIEMHDILDLMESGEFALINSTKSSNKISAWVYLFVSKIINK